MNLFSMSQWFQNHETTPYKNLKEVPETARFKKKSQSADEYQSGGS